MKLLFPFALLLLLLPAIAVAQPASTLDPVTVTSSMSRSKTSTTGRDIVVIRGESFQNLPVHSVDELLRYVPGIEMQQRGPQGSQSDILIRGGTFQQVLVIVNGIRVNDPLTGHFNAYIPVSPSEIERVEVMKGASSAIYGSDAVGGVIHIITKAFTTEHQSNTLGAQLTAGEYGLLNLNAGGYYHGKKTALSAGVLSNNADGQPQRGINGYFHNSTASAGFRYRFSNQWSVGLQSAFDKRDFAAQNFYTAFNSDTATEEVSTWWNHLKITYAKWKDQFTVDAGYKRLRDEYDFNRNAAPNLNRSGVIQTLAVYTRALDNKTRLTAGSQFTGRTIRSNDRGDHNANTVAGFIVLNRQFGEHLHLSPAVRYERGWVPQLNIAFNLSKLVIRASGGRTIRDADFTERYNNYGKPLVTSGNIGNPRLEAESAWSAETGADYFATSRLKLSATVFSKDYRGLIDWTATPYANMPRQDNLSPAGNYYLAKNISRLTTSGLELGAQYRSAAFNGMIGLTFINSDNNASLYISSHAKLLLNYSLSYNYRFLSLAVNGLYKRRETQSGSPVLAALTKEYFLLNARLSARVKKCGLFINADNLTNKTYADRFGVPMPGRWLSAGLSVNLAGLK